MKKMSSLLINLALLNYLDHHTNYNAHITLGLNHGVHIELQQR